MDALLDDLHYQLHDITRYIKRICEQNDIPFLLGFGSCLGAVRHHDIIPWDDDIDLYVPYSEYAHIKQVCQKDNEGKYFFQDAQTDPNYFLYFSKIRKNQTTSLTRSDRDIPMHWGIGVDLFPLFSCNSPTVSKSMKFKAKLAKKIAFMPYAKLRKQGMQQKLLSFVYTVIGQKGREKLLNHLFRSMEVPGDYYFDPDGFTVYKKSVMFPSEFCDFGGVTYPIPGSYDYYLRSLYGDNYMEVPKEGSAEHYDHGDVIIDCNKDFSFYCYTCENM